MLDQEPSTIERCAFGFGLVAVVLLLASAIEGCRAVPERALTAQQCVDACAPRQVAMYSDGRSRFGAPGCYCEVLR